VANGKSSRSLELGDINAVKNGTLALPVDGVGNGVGRGGRCDLSMRA